MQLVYSGILGQYAAGGYRSGLSRLLLFSRELASDGSLVLDVSLDGFGAHSFHLADARGRFRWVTGSSIDNAAVETIATVVNAPEEECAPLQTETPQSSFNRATQSTFRYEHISTNAALYEELPGQSPVLVQMLENTRFLQMWFNPHTLRIEGIIDTEVPVAIEGFVSGGPIVGVQLHLIALSGESKGEELMFTVTEETGEYNFGGLSQGDWRLSIDNSNGETVRFIDEDDANDNELILSLCSGDPAREVDIEFRGKSAVEPLISNVCRFGGSPRNRFQPVWS